MEVNLLFFREIRLALNLLDIVNLAENVDGHILVHLRTQPVVGLLQDLLGQARLRKLPTVLGLGLLA